MQNIVSIVKCDTYEEDKVLKSVRESIDLIGGITSFVKKGETILLKPNLLAGDKADKCVTTNPLIVKSLIKILKEAGVTPIVGDSPGIGSAMAVAKKCGILQVCEDENVPLVDLKTGTELTNKDARTFKKIEVATQALEVDGIINLPKLKTHGQMYLTMAVKNLFGTVPGARKPRWHFEAGTNTDAFAEMILELFLYLRPRLNILDGIMAMEGNGPRSGSPVKVGIIMAAENGVSMDRVATEIIGANYRHSPILKIAEKRNIKAVQLKNIFIKGETIESTKVNNFLLPPLVSANFTASLPPFIDKKLRKMFSSRPHVTNSECTLCNVCVEVCPADVITMDKIIKINYDNCIRCYCCQEMCPHEAISVKDSILKKLIPGM